MGAQSGQGVSGGTPGRARRLVLAVGAAIAAGAATLAGCYGGVYIGFGESGFDDPPSVSLVPSTDSAAAGQRIGLSAAASDDGVVVSVQFLRLEADGAVTSLGTDFVSPWALETTMPAADARFFARATDDRGQHAESAVVTVRLKL